jgi:hypothetical protein
VAVDVTGLTPGASQERNETPSDALRISELESLVAALTVERDTLRSDKARIIERRDRNLSGLEDQICELMTELDAAEAALSRVWELAEKEKARYSDGEIGPQFAMLMVADVLAAIDGSTTPTPEDGNE